MRVAGTMADDALAQYADKLLYLCSAQASHQLIIVAQRKVETQLDGLKLDYVKIDGMVEENKPARAAIWKKVDAKPGTYPIVLNMKTGDFWHGDELQVGDAPPRHALPVRPCHCTYNPYGSSLNHRAAAGGTYGCLAACPRTSKCFRLSAERD